MRRKMIKFLRRSCRLTTDSTQQIRAEQVWSLPRITVIAMTLATLEVTVILAGGMPSVSLFRLSRPVSFILFCVPWFGPQLVLALKYNARFLHWSSALYFGAVYGFVVLFGATTLIALLQYVGTGKIFIIGFYSYAQLLTTYLRMAIFFVGTFMLLWGLCRIFLGQVRFTDFVSCLKCGYNLTGNISGVCPECGAPFDLT